ncbi:hypothetical protein ACIA8K_37620 [Catenuloplanes sp. NPDC051500]|uniref:hypothetical protein n=1 Tax=Catenuloplanes sp. NPDC051500 TaxID=3363959 RepID=UPI00379D4BCA
MNRRARTLAYLMTGTVAIGLGAALATTAFAAETGPAPAAGIEAGTGPIEHRPDGSIVIRSTFPVAIQENAPVTTQADGSLLVAPGTPVEMLPDGGILIG